MKTSTQALYAVLDIAPHSDAATIEAAFVRLSSQYDPAKFHAAAPELRAFAAARYAEIAMAYATLHDPAARLAYNAQIAPSVLVDNIDYRPLPPQRSGATPVRPIGGAVPRHRGGVRGWIILAATILLTLAGTALLVWIGTRPTAAPALAQMPLFASAIFAEIPDQATRDQILSLDTAVAQGRARVQQNPRDANSWLSLADAQYAFIATIYEAAPAGEAYAQNLGRWLEASEAYAQALALDPALPLLRANRALALSRYGVGVGNKAYIDEGLREADRALREDDQTAQVLLNVGRAYALGPAAQMEQARSLWQRVIDLAPTSEQAAHAQRLLDGGKP